MEFHPELFIDFLLNSFVAWCSAYDNKNKEDEFETIYYYIYNTIHQTDGLTSSKKIVYFNALKDIKRKVY